MQFLYCGWDPPGGGTQQSFIWRRFRPEVKTITLHTIFDRKGTPFVYLPQKIVPLSYIYGTTFTKLFIPKCQFCQPFSILQLVNREFPTGIICLQSEKGTPFGRSLPTPPPPVYSIIGSAPPGWDFNRVFA